MTKSDKEQRREDLASTAASLQHDAQQVAEIEDEKQSLDVDDPKVDRLSTEAERLAVQIQHKSRIERDLAAEGPETSSEGRRN